MIVTGGAETGASKDGEYPGLDRFGRVRRQLWVDGAFAGGTGSNPNKPPIVSTLYSYSKASDRLQAVDDRPGAGQPLSQAYTYDGLHRLVEAARGDWNGSAVAVSLGSQRWRNGSGDVTLDALGNWRESWTDLDGSGTYSDTTERDDRTHDIFNRIDARTLKGQGVSGADLTMGPLGYDLASNLSSWKVQAGTSATAVAAVHDAWNRLVDVTYAGDVRTRQEYNALHWRTFRVADTSGTGADPEQARLMYYGHDWRLLQEWIDDDLDFTDWSAGSWKLTDTDRTQQYVWGLRYIDDIVLHRADRNKDGDYVDAGDGTWHHLTDAQYSSVCLVDSAATVVERVTYSAYGIARHHWATDVDGDGAVTTGAGSDFSLVSTIASDTLANRTIGGSAYRSEADLDRSGVIDATDRGLVGSAKAALALGQLGAMGNAAPDNIVGWDGYLFNAESAVYTVRFRSYLPALGRWAERDPIGYVNGMSIFESVGSGPIGYVDPYGLAKREWRIDPGTGKGGHGGPHFQYKENGRNVPLRWDITTLQGIDVNGVPYNLSNAELVEIIEQLGLELLTKDEYKSNALRREIEKLADDEAARLIDSIKKGKKSGCIKKSDLNQMAAILKNSRDQFAILMRKHGRDYVLDLVRKARAAGEKVIMIGGKAFGLLAALWFAQDVNAKGVEYAVANTIVPVELIKEMNDSVRKAVCEFWKQNHRDAIQRARQEGIDVGPRDADRFVFENMEPEEGEDSCCCGR